MSEHHLAGGIAAAALLTLSLTAQATSLSANASAELVEVATTGSATFSIDGGFFFAGALVNDVSDFADGDIYTGVTPGSASAAASAGGTQSAAAAAGYPIASADAVAIATGDALAITLSEMNFTLDGTGQVTLTFESTLTLSATDTDGVEFAEAAVTLTDVFGALEEAYAFVNGAGGDDAFQLVSSLTLIYDVDGLTNGFFSVETAARADTGVAPVPLPAAGWLFAGGLFSLLGLRRRRA